MKLRNDTQSNFDPGGNLAPHLFYGDIPPNTDARFENAPLMSMYLDTTNAVLYVKTQDNALAENWTSLVTTGGYQQITGVKHFSEVGNVKFTLQPSTNLGIGAAVSGKATASEYGDGLFHRTILALNLTGTNDIDLAGDADNSKGVKVYDFPAGRILILGVTINAWAVVNNAFNSSPNDVFYMSVGSADGTQAANGDLTGTEADLIPKTTLDTESNETLGMNWHAALAASAQFDGTQNALDMFVNAAVLNTSTSKAVTVAVTGQIDVTWINLGTY